MGQYNEREGADAHEVQKEIRDEVGNPSADNQTLYQILASQDVDTLTTQGDSIADRVSAYVDTSVSSRASPMDVRKNAQLEGSIMGFEATLGYSAPREIATSVTGGGSVIFGGAGANINAGTTSGDEAKLSVPGTINLDRGGIVHGVEIVGRLLNSSSTGYTDDVRLGLDVAGSSDKIYIDLTNQRMVHDNSGTNSVDYTKALGSWDSSDYFYIKCESNSPDYGGDSVSRMIVDGGSQTDVTLTTTVDAFGGSPTVYAKSNGSGDEVEVLWLRRTYRTHGR